MKLEEIRALIEAATPGPWEATDTGDVWGSDGHLVKKTTAYAGFTLAKFERPNAAFIAASRTLMPKLLKVAEEARVSLDCGNGTDELREALAELESE